MYHLKAIRRLLATAAVFVITMEAFSSSSSVLTVMAAEQPWDGAPFSGIPKDIAAAAKAAVDSKETGVVVLLDEVRVVFDVAGRVEETHRVVYRIGATPPGNWSLAIAVWQPWRQQRPVVRARVIGTNSAVVELDPRTLTETPLANAGVNAFGDGRMLRGTIPSIAPGAVVEEQIIVKDKEPLFDRGISVSIAFGKLVPVLRTRLTLEAPSSLPLKHVVRLLPGVKPVSTVSNGKTTVVFDSGRLDAIDPVKLLLSSAENPKQPYVAFSTGANWREIADGYHRIVDTRIGPSSIADVAKAAVGNATTRSEIIGRLLERVQRTIRHSEVQLGKVAIAPTTPAETLKAASGDSKDQAALLIAMLRTAGIEAYMALLNAGSGPDVEPELPGFSGFSHAIVHVPGDTPLWIDPTARFSRVGQLPLPDQGRLALVVRPETTALVRTPELPSRVVDTTEVTLIEEGQGGIVATKEFFGSLEMNVRAVHNQSKAADVDKSVDEYAKIFYLATAVRKIERSDPTNLSAPLRIRFDIAKSEMAQTSGGEAAFVIPVGLLLADSDMEKTASLDERFTNEGVDLRETSIKEWKYLVVPPTGYRKKEIPEARTLSFGPASLSHEFSVRADGAVVGTVRFDSGKKRYSSQEVAALKRGLENLDKNAKLKVSFERVN